MRTVPAVPERLTRRTRPCTPSRLPREAAGRKATVCVAVAPSVAGWGALDRLDRCPVGLAYRLITSMGRVAFTARRQRPAPSPSAPLRPSPYSGLEL